MSDCEHAVLELDQGAVQMRHGMVHVDTISCLLCPVQIVYLDPEDARDEMPRRQGAGN